MRTHRVAAILTALLATAVVAQTGATAPKPAPTNTSPPAISGSTVSGQTLSANTGIWSGQSSKFAYSWQRCDGSQANCAIVSGRTTSSYDLTSADVGYGIRVLVTATNKFGSASATSALTALVTAAPPPPPATAPQNTSVPTISGQPIVGATLTASQGTWTGTTPMSFSYEWNRCPNGTCTAIGGAVNPTYVAASADVGAPLRVVVRGTNTASSASATSTSTAAVTATTTPPACVSGECMPVGSLPGWTQVFTDEFTTNVPVGGFSNCDAYWHRCLALPADVQAKWFAFPDGWRDSVVGTYMPSKVMSIQNGLMNLHLHSENGVRMVSAPEPIILGGVGSQGGQLYGRYAIRFRADQLVGYKTSFMLWPDSEVWPRDGEIDFPEGNLGGALWNTHLAYVHHQGATSNSDQDAFDSHVTYGNWHTVIIEWMPGRVSFILDGSTIGTTTTRIPNTPMHWVLQTPTTDSYLADLATAGNLQIDWVAVWKPA